MLRSSGGRSRKRKGAWSSCLRMNCQRDRESFHRFYSRCFLRGARLHDLLHDQSRRTPPAIKPTLLIFSQLTPRPSTNLTSRRPLSDLSPSTPRSCSNCKLACGLKPRLGCQVMGRFGVRKSGHMNLFFNASSSFKQNVRDSSFGSALNPLKAVSAEAPRNFVQPESATLRICLMCRSAVNRFQTLRPSGLLSWKVSLPK